MARRKTEVFSLSFLDVIACGFGAIVLFYTILSAQAGSNRKERNDDIQAEVNKLEEEVLEGYEDLVMMRSALKSTVQDTPSEDLAARIIEETERLKQQLAEADQETLSRREAIERLKQDLKSIEEGNRRLTAASKDKDEAGNRVKAFAGTGDRQYLTGLKVGGKRILILVDASASMLDDTLVNVIRMRNMPESRRLMSDKWRRTVATVDWITSQLPKEAKFQAYAFNTQAQPLVEGSAGRWLDANDANSLNGSLVALRKRVPQDGTSLENALAIIATLNPQPDNVLLVTDGLPTQGSSPPAVRKTVDGDGRMRHFERALARVPKGIPISVILLPMEGDPMASYAYWTLARRTGGTFLSPAKDWP